ncbi:MAG TPA: Gfo/Idh/MocA family oxidoreductase [Candidatus Binatia bacterium]|jgi:predicted dehydrogenase|nr:Gfo/Idh/MocA family oxidoreductase [Candidatus Binatia bacterium]
MNGAPLRLAVVGCGSIGSRHARNLRALGAPSIALCDLDRERARRLGSEIGARLATDDLGDLLTAHRPHGVLVCTPPASHLEVAGAAVRAGAHVLCEKPLAPDLRAVDAFLALAERERRFVMMAMCYRFHPALRRIQVRLASGALGRVLGANLWAGQYLPDWHPWADYRTEYSARRALGGGVLLDSIHSFDTVRWLLGEPVEAVGMLARVSDLEIDTEDLAAAILRLEGGAVVEVHVDYLQRHAQSRLEVVGSEGTLAFDGTAIRLRRAGDAAWTEETVPFVVNEMYVAELAEFVDCLASGRRPALDGAEGRATLAVACAVRESAESGRRIAIAETPARGAEASA